MGATITLIAILRNAQLLQRKQHTVLTNYDKFDIIFTDEQQTILHLGTEQLSFLQTRVIKCPKRTFTI